MTRIGRKVLDVLGADGYFVPCLHSVGAPLAPGEKDVRWPSNKEHKYIVHFPETKAIWSFGSGYGGNALLGKKCFALRIASIMANEQGWLAEHMLILGIETPGGEEALHRGGVSRAPAARPTSRCWSRRRRSEGLEDHDDRRGHRVDQAGQGRPALRDQSRSRRVRRRARHLRDHQSELPRGARTKHDLHQRRADAGRRRVVGRAHQAAAGGAHRLAGQAVDAGLRRASAAHPNARFTVAADQIPSLDPDWENPDGVPISAFLFGGRRATTVPLVTEAFDWTHGVYMASTMASETTAAIVGQVGVVRRDPFAMLPFCGYHFGDYFRHWLEDRREAQAPAEHLRRELVPAGREGQVHLAGLRREHAGAEVDHRAHRGQGGGGEDRRSACSRATRTSTGAGSTFTRERFEELTEGRSGAWRKEVQDHAELFESSSGACRRSSTRSAKSWRTP